MKFRRTGTIALMLLVLAALGLFAITQTPNIGVQPTALKADRIIIYKSDRKLVLMHEGQPVKTYRISLGGNPVGTKMQEGDGRTPEGTYKIDWRNRKSAFFLSLHISYPSAGDIRRARNAGVNPGGNIMIHGIKNGLGWLGIFHRWFDWTNGCIAVTNREMLEIWHAVPNGTQIEIRA